MQKKCIKQDASLLGEGSPKQENEREIVKSYWKCGMGEEKLAKHF